MPKSPERHREWIDSEPGPIRLPERWHVLPHELVFVLFLGATWLRLWSVAGFTNTSTMHFGLFLLTLLWLIVWGQYQPSPYRWRVRLLGCLVVSTLSYFSLTSAVPLMYNPSGLETMAWHQDATLRQWDAAWLGDAPQWLMEATPAGWVSDLFMACYFFFFYYLIGGLLYYFAKDLKKFRICMVGFGTLYALGYVGYTLMPAAGPVAEMDPRTGGWLTELGGGIIADRSNGVDVFPSVHVAASVFLLVFDWWHRRTHFWWVLGPVVGLWISTVFLRYHYGVDLLAGVALAVGCLWLTRWYAQSRLCAEVESACEARAKQPADVSESA